MSLYRVIHNECNNLLQSIVQVILIENIIFYSLLHNYNTIKTISADSDALEFGIFSTNNNC